MKIYIKDNMKATYKVDDTWQEIEDEFVMTPIGQKLKSELETEEYKNQLQAYELIQLRQQRETECFSVINRGSLWYDTLTDVQKEELKVWYHEWLTLPNRYGTKDFYMPKKPDWLV